MKIENQVTSLELSKKLKELGVKQESISGWRLRHITDGNNERLSSEWVVTTDGFIRDWVGDESFSAFTVAELGEMLPTFEAHKNSRKEYIVSYRFGDDVSWTEIEDTEANARAKMLIYLLENNLIK